MSKVSIIVPTYNVEKYAEFCFDSLLGQTLQDIEIILVDDGSTDSSGAICDAYASRDARVRVIHQTNRGLGLTRNSGLAVAQGEYIGFVDSDDWVSPVMYQTLYENAVACQADISYCTYQKFWDASELKQPAVLPEVRIWNGEAEVRQYMLDRVGLPPERKQDNSYGASVCMGIFSRKLLDRLGAQFVSERQWIAEDMIFDIDVIPQCTRIVHCDAPFYGYRYNPTSLTTVYKKDRFDRNTALYHEMYRRLKAVYSEEELFDSMSRYLLTVARIAIIQEARFINQNGRKVAVKKINAICGCPEMTAVLKRYRYWKLPWKYALFCWLEKHKLSGVLLQMAVLHSR